MDKVRIIPLGGLDEKHKNMTVIEINNDIFVINAGYKEPDKTKPGVDFVIPRYDYLVENKTRIRAYFLTHSLDSLFTAILYFYDKAPAPIYCSEVTKLFIDGYCADHGIDAKKYDIHLIKPTSELIIGNRVVRTFSLASNSPDAFGISFATDQGNVVLMNNFVIHNDFNKGFTHDIGAMLRICEEKTLVLLMDSTHADHSGYCSPKYRLYNFVQNELKNSPGRIFFALDAPDIFNISDCINGCVKNGKKIALYDDLTRLFVNTIAKTGYLNIQKDTIVSTEDVNRIRPQDLCILMCDFGNQLNSKVALLASGNNDDKIVFLNPTDTFVYANHVTPEFESTASDALDELYRNDCKILRVNYKEFLVMHPCEEDIKTIINMFKPAYYIPIMGSFKKLLSNAKLAVNMDVGLTHLNTFILDNGNIVEFENQKGHVLNEKVITGDLFIDGKGVGDIEASVLEERQKFSDDGVVVLGLTISKSKRKIVAGPDVQARGLVFIKDSESFIREVSHIFKSTVENELAKENYSISYIEEAVKDILFKAIRRILNKTPIIIPIIAEIE